MISINTILIVGLMFTASATASGCVGCGVYGGNTDPVNCTVSEWGPWSTCINGNKIRTRLMLTPAQNGGTCPGLSEFTSCPVDCIVSEWGSWSPCVNFHRTRTRTIVQLPFNEGISCPELCETQICTGCGADLIVFDCFLDQTRNTTVCILPPDLNVLIPNRKGYNKARVRVKAKAIEYAN